MLTDVWMQKYRLWLLVVVCTVASSVYIPCSDHPPVNLTTTGGSVMTVGPYWNVSLHALVNGSVWPSDYLELNVDSFGEYTPDQREVASVDNATQLFSLKDALCEIGLEDDTLTVHDERIDQDITLNRTSLVVRAKWNNSNFTAAQRFSIFPGTTNITLRAIDGCDYIQTYGNNTIKITLDFHNFDWVNSTNNFKYVLSSKIQTSGDHFGTDSLFFAPFDEGCNGKAYKGGKMFTPKVVISLALHQTYEYVFLNGSTGISAAHATPKTNVSTFLNPPMNDIGIYLEQPGYQWIDYPGWKDLYYDPDMSIFFPGSETVLLPEAPTNSPNDQPSFPVGAIVGISVGGFVVLVVVAILIVFFVPPVHKCFFPNRHRSVIDAAELE